MENECRTCAWMPIHQPNDLYCYDCGYDSENNWEPIIAVRALERLNCEIEKYSHEAQRLREPFAFLVIQYNTEGIHKMMSVVRCLLDAATILEEELNRKPGRKPA